MKKKFIFSKQHAYLVAAILLLLIFCNANIYGISPFAHAFSFALVFNGFYSIIVTIAYFAAAVINNLSFIGLVSSALVSALLIIYCIIKKSTKRSGILLLLIFCAFSRVANIYFSFFTLQALMLALLDLIISIGFCYVSFKIVNALLFRGIQCFTSYEKILVCIFITAFFCGLTNISTISFSKLFFTLVLLLSGVVLGSKTVYIACFIAIANMLTGQSVQLSLLYFTFACISAWVSPHNKFLSIAIICLLDAITGVTLDYGFISFCSTLIASIIFLIIPKKLIKRISTYITGSKQSLINSYYISQKQENIRNKLCTMSELFKQLQKCYRDLLITHSSKTKVAQLFASEFKADVCESCINKLGCENINLSPCFETLILRAQERGKVNLLDVPPLLASNCSKINVCLAHINQMASQYVQSSKSANADDNNKLNISLQLGGTSKIFTHLSNQFCNSEKINSKKSLLIKNSLLFQSIVCKECIATEDNNGVHEVLLIVRNADTVNPQILKVCEKYYNTQFERKLCFQTQVSGWSLVALIPQCRYELVCGYATSPKEIGSLNGDNYVYTKLTDSKYLIAICDGMGHGDQANKLSELTINLIESYYKCGLPTQIVLDSVNSIMVPVAESGFSTLDACIVDTTTGEVEFIKIGSSISVVKQGDKSSIIDVESLPLGVVDAIIPTTKKVTLFAGDMVVIASDGIIDTFGSHLEFSNYINNETMINMQLFAESVLEEAQARCNSHRDDMTVIALRLIKKR